MPTGMSESDSALAQKFLEFCQELTSKGKSFNLSLTIGSDFSFSLDTREKNTSTQVAWKKKLSPSTLRRNLKRKEEFLKKKHSESKKSETEEDSSSQNLFCVTSVITPTKPWVD